MKKQTNDTLNYPTIIPGFIKSILFIILSILIINEVFNFIHLRGFENPIAFCLFKLIAYVFATLLLKNSDSTMFIILNHLKDINETMITKLEEIQKCQNNGKLKVEEEVQDK